MRIILKGRNSGFSGYNEYSIRSVFSHISDKINITNVTVEGAQNDELAGYSGDRSTTFSLEFSLQGGVAENVSEIQRLIQGAVSLRGNLELMAIEGLEPQQHFPSFVSPFFSGRAAPPALETASASSEDRKAFNNFNSLHAKYSHRLKIDCQIIFIKEGGEQLINELRTFIQRLLQRLNYPVISCDVKHCRNIRSEIIGFQISINTWSHQSSAYNYEFEKRGILEIARQINWTTSIKDCSVNLVPSEANANELVSLANKPCEISYTYNIDNYVVSESNSYIVSSDLRLSGGRGVKNFTRDFRDNIVKVTQGPDRIYRLTITPPNAPSTSSIASAAASSAIGSPVNAAENFRVSLIRQAKVIVGDDTEVFKLFFDSLDARNFSQALRRLSTSSHPKVIPLASLLLNNKEALGVKVNERAGVKEQAALHYAAINKNSDLCKILETHGADRELKDGSGKSAKDYFDSKPAAASRH